MSTVVERHGQNLRRLAEQLSDTLAVTRSDLASVQAPRLSSLGYGLRDDEVSVRAAWWLVGQWLTAYACGAVESGACLDEAEDWFYGDAQSSLRKRLAPAVRLEVDASPDEAWALLPYLLDPLSQGTRRQVLASDAHQPARESRRLRGVYYTPADVASYMAGRVLRENTTTCLDPASGTGVFLRAVTAADDRVETYGLDIDPLAVEMASFVLLALVGWDSGSPWAAWHAIRMRFGTIDSLTVKPGTQMPEAARRARAELAMQISDQLADGEIPEPAENHVALDHLGDLFPALNAGTDAVLCNPPYAALGARADYAELRARFATYSTSPPSATGNIFLPFLELGTTLGATDSRSAFIVPLSIAHNQGQQFQSLRRSLSKEPGILEFAFFDRTPDAIFGDDVKTRAAIVVQARDEESSLAVTGLTRWTSRSRPQMWEALAPTAIDGEEIGSLVPKLATEAEAHLHRTLRELKRQLTRAVTQSGNVVPSEESVRQWPNSVFVAPTGYNWLGCARDLRPLLASSHDSASPLTALRFSTAEQADAAYAVIGSRLAYWLWRVEGDAFHVPQVFLASLPFDLTLLAPDELARLAAAGRVQWERAAKKPVVALNKGRRSVAFTAAADTESMNTVDAMLAEFFDLGSTVERVGLADWYSKTVVVDETETKRRAMRPEAVLCS